MPAPNGLFKEKLKKFHEDNDEDYLLDDKTMKKIKINKNKAIMIPSKNQSKLDNEKKCINIITCCFNLI